MALILFRSLSVLLLAALVTACGQKGPLYLPAKPPAADAVAPAADEKQDEEEEKQGAAPAANPAPPATN